ncbi:FadR/GntR family transcriptional regulator [Verminephrobacter aporrectodeae]|uniref:FadR/GntR family transcriptional regulator n=1 Tax=Verminephrobacter aporrectodeae TaxID=1110389 RepID=UPI0002375E8D|nr:FadR/GntR family transcriptional regulator [Verminephrobacter aporrectodeae]
MPTLEPINVSRLYRMIASQIKEKIRSGSYRTGERLPAERELAEMLAVSRPSVREALIALEIEGWVDVRVGSGVYVTGPQSRLASSAGPMAAPALLDMGAADLLQARLLVEPHCAELAARHATPAQIGQMQEAALALPGSEQPFRHNDRLHLLIAEASGNAALASTVQHLWALGERSAIFNKLNQHFVYGQVWEQAHNEHLPLLRALQKHQPAAARRAMRDHLLGISRRLGLDASEDREM